MNGFSPRGFALLELLEENNNKPWFDAHRAEFKSALQIPFAQVLEDVSFAMEVHDIRLSGSAKTMFRLHRDVRFAKDKRPYNRHISGLLTPSGTKTAARGALYLRLDVAGGRLGCGHYALSPKELAPIREEMLREPARLRNVVKTLAASGYTLSEESILTSMPRGFSHYKDHDMAKYIRLKSYTVSVPLTQADWLGDTVVDKAAALAQASSALLTFRRPTKPK